VDTGHKTVENGQKTVDTPPFFFLSLLHGDWPRCIAGLEYVSLPARGGNWRAGG
jgi:hypothetical protein